MRRGGHRVNTGERQHFMGWVGLGWVGMGWDVGLNNVV